MFWLKGMSNNALLERAHCADTVLQHSGERKTTHLFSLKKNMYFKQ